MSYLFLLATECLPAGDSSLRYYREMKPGKKNMYCFSPHPINFVINKSDSYRTACHSCLSRNRILLAAFLLKCTVVLWVNIILLSQNGCHKEHMGLGLASYTWFCGWDRQHDVTCNERCGNLDWLPFLGTPCLDLWENSKTVKFLYEGYLSRHFSFQTGHF